MEAYLDNAATTKPCRAAIDKMMEALTENFGNPSSKHRKGVEAERYLRDTTEVLSKEWKVQPKEIVLTSGGTESNNLALIGTALANQRSGKHIIASCFEHPSVYQPLEFLRSIGFRISYIPVDSYGHIRMDELLHEICEDTILVSIMYVNNEIGAVQDIRGIADIIKKRKQDILFHVDAIQAFGKYRIYPKREGIDLLSVSGHKIHAPKGTGALYIRDRVKIKPVLYGGGQQRDLRSGTENVPAIAGFGAAVEYSYRNFDETVSQMRQCRDYLIQRLLNIEGVTIHAQSKDLNAPHIVSAGFEGVKSEVLLHALEEKQVYVSSGSACSSNHPALSGTLKAIGVAEKLLDSTLRFSIADTTSVGEIDYAIDSLEAILPVLRRIKQR